jgi:outer membrane protein TolC
MKNIAIIIGLLLASAVNAQDTLKLSLLDAIQHSLSNNKSIQSEKLNDRLNEYRTKELNSAFYPIIDGTAGVTHYLDVPQQYVAASALSSTAPSDQYVRLELLLPNSFNVGISANWTLYNQGLYSARKILNAQIELSDIQFEKNKSELAFTVSQLYYGIIFLQRQQESLLKVAANADRLIRILQRNYDNGTIKKSDLEKALVSKVNIASQIDGLKTAFETQSKLLKLMLGVSETTGLQLTESDFKESLIPLTTSKSGAQTSFDLQLIQTQIELSSLERKSIQASYLPTLGLSYSYSYNTVSPEFRDVLNSRFSYPMQFVGVNLSMPIFDGNRNLFRLKQNAVRNRQLDLQSQYLSEKIDIETANSLLQYNSSLKTIDSNEANIKLAQTLFDQSVLEYEQGTITINDVLTTENSLHQALTAYFNSVSNALVALLEYKKVTNTILD